MKKLALLALAVALAALAAVLLWPSTESPVQQDDAEPLAAAPAEVPGAPHPGAGVGPRFSGFHGSVVDAKGAPVAGAIVQLFPHDGELLGVELELSGCGSEARALLDALEQLPETLKPAAETRSGADGTFSFDSSADAGDRPQIIATYGELGAAVEPNGAGPFVLKLRPDVEVRGRVHDSAGRGLADVTVVAISARPRRAISKSDGTFVLRVPAADMAVLAWREGLLAGWTGFLWRGSGDLDLELRTPRHVAGRVVRGGRGVAGAAVTLAAQGCLDDVDSAADGTFSFELVPPDDVEVTAKEGGDVAFEHADLETSDERSMVLKLERGERFEVTVLDAKTHGPVAGARVELIKMEELVSEAPVTGPGGKATLGPFPPGPRQLVVHAERYVDPESRFVTHGPLTVELQPAIRCAGRVVTASGEPIAGADVGTSKSFDSTPTAANGSFELFSQFDGAKVKVTARGYAPWEGPGSEEMNVVLSLGGKVQGRVTEQNGAPVANAFVTDPTRSPMALIERMRTRTDGVFTARDGTFVLDGLAPGERSLFAVKLLGGGEAVRATSIVRVTTGQSGEVSLVFEEPRVLTGRTVARGVPVAGVKVTAACWAGEVTATTGQSGTFSMKLAREPCEVDASAPGWISRSQSLAKDATSVELELERVAVVRGQVVTRSGQPVRRFTVAYQEVESSDGRFARTAPQGPFEIEADGFAKVLLPAVPQSGPDVDVGRVVLRRSREVGGRVLDPNGRPLEGADVRQRGLNDTFTTTEDGVWSLSVDSSEVELVASHPDYPEAVERLRAGATSLDFRMSKGATARGHVRTKDGKPVSGAQVWVGTLGSATTDGDGAWEMPGLPPGTAELELRRGDAAFDFATQTKTATLLHDAATTIDFTVVAP